MYKLEIERIVFDIENRTKYKKWVTLREHEDQVLLFYAADLLSEQTGMTVRVTDEDQV